MVLPVSLPTAGTSVPQLRCRWWASLFSEHTLVMQSQEAKNLLFRVGRREQ
jgi:hypothetical protein